MKTWYVSRRFCFALFALSLLGATAAHANVVGDAAVCLAEGRTPCVEKKVAQFTKQQARSFEGRLVKARLHFYQGRMQEAVEEMQAAGKIQAFGKDSALGRELALMERTQKVHARLIETTRGDITIVHHPGMDRILIDDAVSVLELGRKNIAPLLGGDPPIPLRVEIYPTGADLTACTGLPLEAVQTTGVVAISKWNRLLITSPRAMGGGYGWQDTLVHEWIHLVASWHSGDRAPVWLQEGIAKGLDMLWRKNEFELPVHMQSLLSRALRDDDFVGFDEMHPSFALLDSAERAGLAYAQVATMVAFLREKSGSKAMADVLKRIAEGEDSKTAVAVVYGASFGIFQNAWKQWVSELELVQKRLSAMPTVLDGQGGEFSTDPVLAARKELRDKTRLGDLMAQRGHHRAAIVYYQKAIPKDEPAGPELVERLAKSLIELKEEDRAVRWLEAAIENYPEHAGTRKLLGERYVIAGRKEAALEQFKSSANIYPYVPQLQQALVDLYTSLGELEDAKRHQGYLDILNYRDSG